MFQLEAEWDTPVRERLLEQSLEGDFDIQTETGTRRIALRGKADRIDLLEDRTFRIIDYKLSRAPDRKQALQLPVYTVCTIQHLRKTRGEEWEPGQAGYIAFGQDRQFVPMLARGKTKDTMLVDAQARLLDAVDRIERGEFPPTPADTIDVHPLRPCRGVPEGLRWRRLSGCPSMKVQSPKSKVRRRTIRLWPGLPTLDLDFRLWTPCPTPQRVRGLSIQPTTWSSRRQPAPARLMCSSTGISTC